MKKKTKTKRLGLHNLHGKKPCQEIKPGREAAGVDLEISETARIRTASGAARALSTLRLSRAPHRKLPGISHC